MNICRGIYYYERGEWPFLTNQSFRMHRRLRPRVPKTLNAPASTHPRKLTRTMKKFKIFEKLRRSPINYFSDLFIVSMVVMWIVDNIYQSVIATIVTISSILLSSQTGMNCYDTSMWATIGTNVAIPLSCGGAIWMIKNSVQHAIMNHKGRLCPKDFPKVNAEGQDDGFEEEMTMNEGEG